MGQELLCELDGVLHMVWECPDKWFGGINIIFSSDLYQHELVGKHALFMPVPKSTSTRKRSEAGETKNRQGHIGWKQVDTVIELTEQKRMMDDADYVEAVLRYRKCESTLDDVELFNSWLIKSLENPHGVDLGTPAYWDASAIVSHNRTCQILNLDKALAQTTGGHAPRLIRCHAKHTTRGKTEVPADIHTHFVDLEGLSDDNKSQPPVLDLYIGAPMVVQQGNISIELGVTMGAQGIVRSLEQLNSGDIHASLAIVEFPHGNFQLDGLPRNYFPIKATSRWVSQVMWEKNDDSHWQIHVHATWYQLPFELAFAVTAHSAQGKTMLCVVCDLNTSDVGGYVAASRAHTREGLVIMHKAVHESFANQAKKRFLRYFRLQVKIWKTQNQLPLV